MNQNIIWIFQLTAFTVDFTVELNCTQQPITTEGYKYNEV